ncbi:glycoprotein-N-acetylgalactosamine 3-beta-galactosyltransferase 1 isoform X1 [Lingula anatina]|uniref:N-acetylgalactosaminide beta-1,3-galactosyltransferase n=1 Tax=Lingula anatina TaxID=7574 RepID=A0A1S3ISF9_LINAN|nr:glycoprotein-N-acetylgalactosamine 3-beta-galactosyltransferase 1 isoform X1 [Lingula anatina]|eukprot:XP_013401137.1 glycoprotein-N-acetylgalactosamine 3-beta-galactosyltransferase 1 isoform X1 [Lingula anatina]
MPTVLCWLLTDPPDLDKRVIHVRDTWARRCDVTLFMSSMENKTFPTIGLRVPPGRGYIAKKAKAAWKYIYEHHLNDADFFIKADPDTYVIVENLKHYLTSRDPKRAEFYGHQFYPSDWEFNADTRIKKSVYMSGGPGLVLSREAVRLLVTKAINSDPKCLQDGEEKGPPLPRVLCWLLTDPPDLDKRVIHVRDTWARRCDVTLFMSSMENKTFPTIGLRVPPGRGHIAKKAKAAWKYIYEHHLNDADFFIKADPDTYVIVENLKHYLTSRDPKRAEFYGHQFYPSDWEFNADTRIKKSLYMSGGPGLVLSREAVRLLVTKAINSDPKCLQDGEAEDMKTAKCLLSVGAEPVDTRDELGRERFMIFPPYVHLKGHYADWYKKGDAHGAVEGFECCSRYPISFHYIKPDVMYEIEYYVYRMDYKRINEEVD